VTAEAAVEKIGATLDDYFRGNLTHTTAFFDIVTVRSEYEAAK
jgi:hypothetical protein